MATKIKTPRKNVPQRSPHLQFRSGISACAEPLPDRSGPPQTMIDKVVSPLPLGPQQLEQAHWRVQTAPLVLRQICYLPPVTAAEQLMELAYCHLLVGDLTKGRELSEQAIVLWREAGDPRQHKMSCECLMRAARCCQHHGDVPEAIRLYQRILALPVGVPAGPARFNVLHSVADLLHHLGRNTEEVAPLREALAIAKAGRLGEMEIYTQFRLGDALSRCERGAEALVHAQEVMAAVTRAGASPEMVDGARFLLIHCYRLAGQPLQAAAEQEKLVRWARDTRAPRATLIEFLVHAAMFWGEGGEMGRARQRWEEALPLVIAEGNKPLAALVRNNLATFLETDGDLRAADASHAPN